MYAEVTFSPTFASCVCEEGLKLPSYESKFYGYRSLSPDSEVLTITFNGLPRQYGRRGYAVLELRESSESSLSHEFHWQFAPLNDNNTYGQNRSSEYLVYAHWLSMPPYCRYCHSPAHAIADCPVKLRSIICYNYNGHGHTVAVKTGRMFSYFDYTHYLLHFLVYSNEIYFIRKSKLWTIIW
ncbi:hypothetical protein G6F46_012019 [Rhizopus delemar]|nr:hypothetical protein G6F54_012555 [Rhizopus delemar]KAG1497641.1 hypothetical protein G6F53_011925 [Rhizopus delemar]KAG1540239.1 hypothetical protein G6F49_012178 [Rhizopus delemar]KAG1577790.1 hypothetical protein G6F48_012436 [Rhizopus delemar]KAG1582104.1 hypothetical protein G6F47_012288 [Rhizopus delemar]